MSHGTANFDRQCLVRLDALLARKQIVMRRLSGELLRRRRRRRTRSDSATEPRHDHDLQARLCDVVDTMDTLHRARLACVDPTCRKLLMRRQEDVLQLLSAL